jgi:signal peptidase I
VPKAALALAVAVLLGIGLAYAAKASGLESYRASGSSMAPELRHGDWIVAREFESEDRRAIDRQDIVVFRFPLGSSGRAVKRVIATEGDQVVIGERSIRVGSRVIPIEGAPSSGAARSRVEIVPRGHVFLLGENTAVSIDSRSIGPVPEEELVGRVLFAVPKQAPVALLVVGAFVVAIALLVARRRRRSPA